MTCDHFFPIFRIVLLSTDLQSSQKMTFSNLLSVESICAGVKNFDKTFLNFLPPGDSKLCKFARGCRRPRCRCGCSLMSVGGTCGTSSTYREDVSGRFAVPEHPPSPIMTCLQLDSDISSSCYTRSCAFRATRVADIVHRTCNTLRRGLTWAQVQNVCMFAAGLLRFTPRIF